MNNPSPLSGEKAQQIISALQRFNELDGGSAIVNPRNEAELTGLKNFFSTVLVEHGFELMGNWIAVRDEYEPLVQVIERVANRVSSITANRRLQQQAQQPIPTKEGAK
jgi:hypothetical protein